MENSAGAEGGGLWNGSGTMNVFSTTIGLNSADGPEGDQGGGGLFNAGGILILTNATVSGNTANAVGGGITNSGELVINYSTIALNSSGSGGGGISQNDALNSTSLTGSIVARNMANDVDGMGTFNSGGFNIVESDANGVFTSGDDDTVGEGMDTLNVNLGPLQNNGGPTLTHALTCPSIAIDAAAAAGTAGSVTDQRGQMVFGSNRDIGAFELQEVCATNVRNLPVLAGSKVYPNPTRGGNLSVALSAENTAGVELRLLDAASGRLLLRRDLRPGITTLNTTENILPGMYIIELIGQNAYVAHRVVISR
jgi:hypothetical protein